MPGTVSAPGLAASAYVKVLTPVTVARNVPLYAAGVAPAMVVMNWSPLVRPLIDAAVVATTTLALHARDVSASGLASKDVRLDCCVSRALDPAASVVAP